MNWRILKRLRVIQWIQWLGGVGLGVFRVLCGRIHYNLCLYLGCRIGFVCASEITGERFFIGLTTYAAHISSIYKINDSINAKKVIDSLIICLYFCLAILNMRHKIWL